MTTLQPRLRGYDYQRLIDGPGRTLSRVRPRRVYEILMSNLNRLTEVEGRDAFYVFRSAIEGTEQDLVNQSNDHLISGVRDSLLDLADADEADLPAILTGLLSSDHSIFRRLALFLVTERPWYISAIDPALLIPASIYEPSTYHEHMRLLKERCLELPADIQRRIHDVIHEGLDIDPPDADNVGDDADGRREKFLRTWHLLNVLPAKALRKDERRRKIELLEKLGPPDHPLFMSWSSGVQVARAPADVDQMTSFLKEGGHGRLLEVLRNPRQFLDLDWMHSEELLWEVVADLVPSDPNYHLKLAKLLETSDFPDAWRYLNAYEELAKNGVSFDWHLLLLNMQRLTTGEGAEETYWSVARILGTAVRGAHPAGDEDLGLVMEIALHVLGEAFNALKDVDSIERDLVTHQLNDPAGMAADAVVAIGFREALGQSTEEEKTTSFPDRTRMSSTFRSILDRGILEGWGGVELRFAIGQMLHFIIWSDQNWLGPKLDDLLPLNPSTTAELGAWRAFWAGHLRTTRLREPIMADLKDRYAALLFDAAREEPVILGENWQEHDRNLLGSHLMVAWLSGYDGFGRDALFGQFISSVSDEARGHLVGAMAHEMGAAKKSDNEGWKNRVLGELEQFWLERTEVAKPSTSKPEISKELSAFALWLEEIDQGPEAIEERLTVMSRHIELDYLFERLMEYLSRFALSEPDASIRILRVLTNRIVTSEAPVWHLDLMPEIVREGWESTSEDESKAILRSIVNDLLEKRGIDLRNEIE